MYYHPIQKEFDIGDLVTDTFSKIKNVGTVIDTKLVEGSSKDFYMYLVFWHRLPVSHSYTLWETGIVLSSLNEVIECREATK